MPSAATLARQNRHQQRYKHDLRRMIERIDRIKKSPEADDAIMSKHYYNTTDNGERVWRFED